MEIKVKSLKETTDLSMLTRRTFTIEYEEGPSFEYDLVKECSGEWVLQGDSRARYCLSELQHINSQLEELNNKKHLNCSEEIEEKDIEDKFNQIAKDEAERLARKRAKNREYSRRSREKKKLAAKKKK